MSQKYPESVSKVRLQFADAYFGMFLLLIIPELQTSFPLFGRSDATVIALAVVALPVVAAFPVLAGADSVINADVGVFAAVLVATSCAAHATDLLVASFAAAVPAASVARLAAAIAAAQSEVAASAAAIGNVRRFTTICTLVPPTRPLARIVGRESKHDRIQQPPERFRDSIRIGRISDDNDLFKNPTEIHPTRPMLGCAHTYTTCSESALGSGAFPCF
jgi:hypothetical protein